MAIEKIVIKYGEPTWCRYCKKETGWLNDFHPSDCMECGRVKAPSERIIVKESNDGD